MCPRVNRMKDISKHCSNPKSRMFVPSMCINWERNSLHELIVVAEFRSSYFRFVCIAGCFHLSCSTLDNKSTHRSSLQFRQVRHLANRAWGSSLLSDVVGTQNNWKQGLGNKLTFLIHKQIFRILSFTFSIYNATHIHLYICPLTLVLKFSIFVYKHFVLV